MWQGVARRGASAETTLAVKRGSGPSKPRLVKVRTASLGAIGIRTSVPLVGCRNAGGRNVAERTQRARQQGLPARCQRGVTRIRKTGIVVPVSRARVLGQAMTEALQGIEPPAGAVGTGAAFVPLQTPNERLQAALAAGQQREESQRAELEGVQAKITACGHRARAEFPDTVRGPVQYGPRFQAMAVYLQN